VTCPIFLSGSTLEIAVRSERITWLEREAMRLRQEMNAVASRAQKEIGKLRRDELEIKKELHDLRGRGKNLAAVGRCFAWMQKPCVDHAGLFILHTGLVGEGKLTAKISRAQGASADPLPSRTRLAR
jgi:hypothetical protein